MEKASGFMATSGIPELEILTLKVDSSAETFPYKVTIGEPILLFPTIKNSDRKWWQIWKPARIIDPQWADIYEAARAMKKV